MANVVRITLLIEGYEIGLWQAVTDSCYVPRFWFVIAGVSIKGTGHCIGLEFRNLISAPTGGHNEFTCFAIHLLIPRLGFAFWLCLCHISLCR